MKCIILYAYSSLCIHQSTQTLCSEDLSKIGSSLVIALKGRSAFNLNSFVYYYTLPTQARRYSRV